MTLESSSSTVSSHTLRTSSLTLEFPTMISVAVSSASQVMDSTKLYTMSIISTSNTATISEFTVVNSFPETTASSKTADVTATGRTETANATFTSWPKTADVTVANRPETVGFTITSFPITIDVSISLEVTTSRNTPSLQGTTYVISPSLDPNDVPKPTPTTPTIMDMTLSYTVSEFPLSDLPTTSRTSTFTKNEESPAAKSIPSSITSINHIKTVTITRFPKTTDVSISHEVTTSRNTDTLQGTTYIISPSLDTNDVPKPTPTTPTIMDMTLSYTVSEFPLSDLPTTSRTSTFPKIEESPPAKSMNPNDVPKPTPTTPAIIDMTLSNTVSEFPPPDLPTPSRTSTFPKIEESPAAKSMLSSITSINHIKTVTITRFPKTTDVSISYEVTTSRYTDTLQGTTHVISPSLDTNDVPIPTPTPATIDVTLNNTIPEFPLSDLPTSRTSTCQIISTQIEQSPAVKSIPPSVATVSTMRLAISTQQEPQLSQPTQKIMSTPLVTTFERELQQSRANEVSKRRFSTLILNFYIYIFHQWLM